MTVARADEKGAITLASRRLDVLERYGAIPVTSVASVANPHDGMGVYQDSNDIAEGLYFHTGLAWRKVWNLPWGIIGYAQAVADQTGITGVSADITGLTITWTAVGNRYYRISGLVQMQMTAGAGQLFTYITDAAGVIKSRAYHNAGAADVRTLNPGSIEIVGAGSATRKFRAQQTGTTASVLAAATTPNWICVEDIGPSGAPV